jgi:hypothetical protein
MRKHIGKKHKRKVKTHIIPAHMGGKSLSKKSERKRSNRL